MGCRFRGLSRLVTIQTGLLLAALLAFGAFPSQARAADVETRDFEVKVDGKPAGDAHMTFHRTDDGTITMSADTDVRVQPLPFVTYRYSYRGREVWKDGRLVKFESVCNDDNKRFAVAAVAEKENLRLRVNDQERLVRGDVWLTSYWNKPDARHHNQTIPLVDADTGRDMTAQVLYVGVEQLPVAGQVLPVHHYRLTGKVNVDLWYDGSNRLVRQNFVEQGHRTLIELVRVRR